MIVFVSDLFVDDYVGGGELTTEAIIDKTSIPVLKIHASKITPQIVDALKDRHWIFGNFSALSLETILHCCKNLNYSIIEYDYKYCLYRLPQKHIAAEGTCNCENTEHGKMVSVFLARAKSLWFMSVLQRDFYYEKFPFLEKETTHVLSSVFSDHTLESILDKQSFERNDTWLIQNSTSWVKGTEDAVRYAKDNDLKYELFSGLKHEEVLDKFSKYKGFIFLPRSFDTCPRTVIEAKLLGCEIITNNNTQHKDEGWFNGANEGTLEYLRARVKFFWQEIYKNTRAPNRDHKEEETHFKIVIPVYNSEEWIERVLVSIQNQKYNNYECIVCDDISTDSTWPVIQSLELSDKFKKTVNKEKKFALKNIYDGTRSLDPSGEDVIIVLDGDDWLSNENVLSKLNEYYSKEKCLVTFGSFVRYPDGTIGQESSEYPKEVVKENRFREDQWRASHLKTFKYSLWQKVDVKDLHDDDGKFYEISYDQAMMLPLLEMAGERAKYIPEVLCVYNVGNPNAVNKTRAEKQYQTMLRIRKKKRYDRLQDN